MKKIILFLLSTSYAFAGVTPVQVTEISTRIKTAYAKELRSRNLGVKFEHKVEDQTINAYSVNRGKNIHVALLGGLTRHRELFYDGIAAISCYELGRHIGGAPYRGIGNKNNISSVGQSEYFAGTQCLKRIFYADDNVELTKLFKVDPLVNSLCRTYHKNENDIALCIRISYAGMQVTKFLKDVRKEDTKLQFSINSGPHTDSAWPELNCRLETYFQGAICDQDPFISVEDNDLETGFCTRSKGYGVGVRPSCWHKVGDFE